MSKSNQPLVSIHCITYNHEKFIAETLESFLMQKTSFDYEIIIHDDASTDRTQAIIEAYAKKHPEKFKLVLEKNNQLSKGNDSFINDMFLNSRGKYIAQCEGDDYWTDPNKLQAQVDYMEKHKEASLCFHPVKVVYQDSSRKSYIYPGANYKTKDFTTDNLLKQNFIQSNSVMYRKLKDSEYRQVGRNIMPRDWYMLLFHAQYGEVAFINRTMSVYRKNDGGIWWATGDQKDFWVKQGLNHIKLFNEFLTMYGKSKTRKAIIMDSIYNVFSVLVDIDTRYKLNLVKDAMHAYPELAHSYILHERQAELEATRKVGDLRLRLDNKTNELDTIYNSKGWKLLDKIYSTRAKVGRPKT